MPLWLAGNTAARENYHDLHGGRQSLRGILLPFSPAGRRHPPESRDAVGVEGLIDTHDREAAFERLGREQPIEGIAMMERQGGDASQVGWLIRSLPP